MCSVDIVVSTDYYSTAVRYINQKGFVSLFFIIPIALVVTGIIGIRFLALPSPLNLPQYLGQFQQEPKLSSTPASTVKLVGEIQTKPFVYTNAPSFIISAPLGWVKTGSSGNELVRFESPEIDNKEVEGGGITTNAIISIKATDNYKDLDDFVSQYKASGSKVTEYQILNSSSVGNGNRLELKYRVKIGEKEVTVHELAHLFFKDGISFLVKGYTADYAWDKRSGGIRSSLESFKFE